MSDLTCQLKACIPPAGPVFPISTSLCIDHTPPPTPPVTGSSPNQIKTPESPTSFTPPSFRFCRCSPIIAVFKASSLTQKQLSSLPIFHSSKTTLRSTGSPIRVCFIHSGPCQTEREWALHRRNKLVLLQLLFFLMKKYLFVKCQK